MTTDIIKNKKLFLAILLILISSAVYFNSLKGALFWDDESTVLNNVFIRNPIHYLSQIFTTSYHSGSGETLNFYRPLATLSFSLDYRIWKFNPFGYHLFNVILHILSGILAFFILNKLFSSAKLSFISALLFLVHPINSEAVNYVSNRTDLLMLVFFLAAFYSYVFYRQKGKPVFLVLSYLSYVCTILSKEMGLILPVFILIYEFTFSKHKKKITPFLGFVLVFLVYITLRATLLNFLKINLITQGAQEVPYSRDMLLRLLVFANICLGYLKLFFLPLNLHMEYDVPLIKSVLLFSAWLNLLFLVSLAVILFYLGRNKKEIIFGGAWFICGLLPVSGIIPINTAMSEHYLYLASLGIFTLFSFIVLNVWRKTVSSFKPFLSVCGLLVLAASCLLTFSRNRVWQDPLQVYLEITEKTKNSFRANNNAGVEYFRRGNIELAEKYFLRSREIMPTYAEALNNLGVISERRGDLSQAEKFYKSSLDSKPDYLLAHQNLANIYLMGGRIKEARQELKQIIKIYPYDSKASVLLERLNHLDNNN